MQRLVSLALTGLVLVLGLAGCRPIVPEADPSITVYATFYPIYALSEGVMRDIPDTQLHCLVQPQDGCLRNYQLSDWDSALLKSGADAVIAGGRGLESFEDTLFSWGDNGPAISAVLYNLELLSQQQAADAEALAHWQGDNPHLYMSIEGAKQLVQSISAMMLSLDPDYSDSYIANEKAALDALDALLDASRQNLADCAGQPVILMSESLGYVARDYSLAVAEQIEREPGTAFGDNELVAWLKRLSLSDAKVVLIEQQAPQTLVEALETAGYAVGRIDVLSTHQEGEGFDSYLEIQRKNAQAILDAFERADAGKEEH